MILKLSGATALLGLAFFDWEMHGVMMGAAMNAWLLLPTVVILAFIFLYAEEKRKPIFLLSTYTAWILIFSLLFNLLSVVLVTFLPKALLWEMQQVAAFYWLSPALSVLFSLLGGAIGFLSAHRLERHGFFSS